MFGNTILLALRSIRRNLLRSFLTILGIVIGVSAVITMVTLGNGATLAVQTQIQGLGTNFFPDNLNRDILDRVHDAPLDESIRVARELAVQEGILAGISSGANVKAAVDLAKKPENKGKRIVTVVADFGERYISTLLYEDLRD